MTVSAFPKGNETGSWIATYTGKWIEPLDPDPGAVDIEDIAHSLSNQCRFTGHTREFYSTAQHCWYVSRLVPEELALWGLLHDASEAYVSDVARPVKHADAHFGEVYRAVEETLLEAVATRFGLTWPEPEEIKVADKMMLRAEQRDLMANDPDPDKPIFESTVTPWLPVDAKQAYLARFYELS